MLASPGRRSLRAAAAALLALPLLAALAGCGGPDTRWGEGSYKVGRPYQINGRWYRPRFDPDYDRVGTASWYGDDFRGLSTANGEVFDPRELSAAHPTLPLPSVVRVTNLANGRSLDLRLNDRGPFVGDRMIDLSQAAARKLGFERAGLATVRVRWLRLADARGTPPSPAPEVAVADAPPPRRPRPRAAPLLLADAAGPSCAGAGDGPRHVELGVFADTPSAWTAAASLRGLSRVRVEPAGDAAARVRLGPAPDLASALDLLARVQGLGHPDAFVAPTAAC